MELNWVQLKTPSSLWHWGLEDTRGCDGVREGMRDGGVLNAAARVGVEDSDSCHGGWRGTGCSGVPGVGRPVLLNHLSQPFGKVEVSPDGEETLCREAEKGVSSFHYREQGLETETRVPGLNLVGEVEQQSGSYNSL